MKTEYVLGFLFNEEGTGVVLVRKNKPEEQAGLLNGGGGKIEPLERAAAAMLREGEEELGVITIWQPFAKLNGESFVVYCYRSFDSYAYEQARTMTSEEVVKIHPEEVSRHAYMPGLDWLVAIARDRSRGEGPFYVDVTYKEFPTVPVGLNKGTMKAATLICKVRVQSVTPPPTAGGDEHISIGAVYSDDPNSENKQWSKYTPVFNLSMTISNPSAQGKLQPGKEYYIEIIPVEEAPAAEAATEAAPEVAAAEPIAGTAGQA